MKLRPLREADLASLSPWFPRVAADLACDAWAGDGALRRAVGQDDILAAVEHGPAGILSYEIDAPDKDSARIRLLAIDPSRRRLGIGSRAALALEKRLAGKVGRIYVTVPSKLGLAFYFWLRLGYQPLTQSQWPAPPEEPPSAWMVRPLG